MPRRETASVKEGMEAKSKGKGRTDVIRKESERNRVEQADRTIQICGSGMRQRDI